MVNCVVHYSASQPTFCHVTNFFLLKNVIKVQLLDIWAINFNSYSDIFLLPPQALSFLFWGVLLFCISMNAACQSMRYLPLPPPLLLMEYLSNKINLKEQLITVLDRNLNLFLEHIELRGQKEQLCPKTWNIAQNDLTDLHALSGLN